MLRIPNNFIQNKYRQKGFTLIELLIGLVLTGILASAIIGIIGQIYSANIFSSNRLVAVKQVENAVYYMSRHSQMAQQITPTKSDGTPLTDTNDDDNGDGIYNGTGDSNDGDIDFNLVAGDYLEITYIDWDTTTHKVTIVLNNGEIQETEIINEGLPSQSIRPPTVVGRYITNVSGDWNLDTKVLTLNVTATINGRHPAIETREFQIIPRPA